MKTTVETRYFSNTTSFQNACASFGVKATTVNCASGEVLGAHVFENGLLTIKLVCDEFEYENASNFERY
jgi:hypothetical protein